MFPDYDKEKGLGCIVWKNQHVLCDGISVMAMNLQMDKKKELATNMRQRQLEEEKQVLDVNQKVIEEQKERKKEDKERAKKHWEDQLKLKEDLKEKAEELPSFAAMAMKKQKKHDPF
mgnify:CR=1 FL=1